ncbi:MAG: hypothetical protein PHQ40_12510 [Anaerolineaceae bacterium]|nr:hypothetical protein [Anaerolineaceae bacterium]
MAWIDIGNGVGVGEGESVGVLVGGAGGVAVGTSVAVDGAERVGVDSVGSGAGCGMDRPQALSAGHDTCPPGPQVLPTYTQSQLLRHWLQLNFTVVKILKSGQNKGMEPCACQRKKNTGSPFAKAKMRLFRW